MKREKRNRYHCAGKFTPSEPSPLALIPSLRIVEVLESDPDPIAVPSAVLLLIPVSPSLTPRLRLKSSLASTIRVSISTCSTGRSSSVISFFISLIFRSVSCTSSEFVRSSTVTLPRSDRSRFSPSELLPSTRSQTSTAAHWIQWP